ncbi:MAG: hypothetical protein MRK00_00850 [Nitrosomonas sp.]|nr:hypothetical protein [Nitrosomonas sp.]
MSKISSSTACIFLFLFSILTTSCNSNSTVSVNEQALKIRTSINDNKVENLYTLTSLPLIVREQEWQSADDGRGFILGKVNQIVLSTKYEFSTYMTPLLKNIVIEGQESISEGITLDIFTDELGKQSSNWNDLNLVLFKRGEGDVEHIILMGLSKETNKLRAIYIN